MSFSIIVMILALLVIATNIIVQVIKEVSGLKERPTKIVVTIVAIMLTVLVTVIAFQVLDLVLIWYHLVASIIVGFVVAYGAMFGFDNLYGELLDKLKTLLENKR